MEERLIRSSIQPASDDMLWSPKARQGHPLHRICAYQGSFPPQLPAYFLDKYGGGVVLDPFCGRGTTLLEAVLRGYCAYGADVAPVALALSRVKLACQPRDAVLKEIRELDLDGDAPPPPKEIEPFYHPDTWRQLFRLRESRLSDTLKALVLGRLHGHSPGFLSSFTFNVISVTGDRLRRLQEKHKTAPERRDVRAVLEQAARRFIPERGIAGTGKVFHASAEALPLPDSFVDTVITSPPFLDVIDYYSANWLRHWFLGEQRPVKTFVKSEDDYRTFLRSCLVEIARVLRPDGVVVFEVGPIRRNLRMLDLVVDCASGVLHVEEVVVNDFSKEAVPKISRAMRGGSKTTTMTNQCVVMRRR